MSGTEYEFFIRSIAKN